MPFTVIDVLRERGIELVPAVTWACGTAAREAWLAHYGRLPDKALRKKTNGKGSHCFAVYPDYGRSLVEQAITATLSEIDAVAAMTQRLPL